QGNTYTLSYTIKFPLVSPEFYLVGPLRIGSFSEGREWQIASDAITLVQSNSNVANSGLTVTTTLSTLTANHLEVEICSVAGSVSITQPSRGSGGTRGNTWTANAAL